jgi:Tfp pilus assembly protein PilF
MQFMWENTLASVPITTDVDSKVTAQIKEVLEKDNRPYFQAGLYYLENGKDLNQALTWLDKAAEQQPDAYWVHLQRANCLAKLGKKEDAKAASQKSRELAVKAGNDDYVRLNDKLMAQLK